MRASSENYKGIEFVRISMLPEEQKKMIWTSLKRDKIIKILKNDCLLNDCVQANDYEQWYTENYKVDASNVASSNRQPATKQKEFTLAFK